MYVFKQNDFCMDMFTCYIKPHTATCGDGDLKLVGGASEMEGRLEVCFNRRWSSIDGEGWTYTDTQIACKQLILCIRYSSETSTSFLIKM